MDEEICTLTRQFQEIQMRLHELKRQKNSLRWHQHQGHDAEDVEMKVKEKENS